jgi:hypothetical protein
MFFWLHVEAGISTDHAQQRRTAAVNYSRCCTGNIFPMQGVMLEGRTISGTSLSHAVISIEIGA